MGLFRRLVDTFRRDRLQADAQDELAFHMEQRVQELMRSGYTPDEARLVARQRIGNGTLASEAAAEADIVVRPIASGLVAIGVARPVVELGAEQHIDRQSIARRCAA